MAGKRLSKGNLTVFDTGDACLMRPRLQNLLKNAMNYPLAVICAGAGYGKTSAVSSFLSSNKENMVWIQLSERDNITARFWENYTGMISLSWPEAGKQLSRIGFPKTDEAFTKYISVLREITKLPGKHVRVFDDFHLLENPVIINFFEKAVNLIPPNVTILLISRTMPEINLIGMMMREQIFTINEDVLCFTEDEISDYFNHHKLSVTSGDIRNIYNDTQGWAFAINLIGRSLVKEQKYERYAIEAMKKNIFRLIEAETSGVVHDKLWRFLLRISLIDHLAASLIKLLAKDDVELIKEMEHINAFIRYDYHMDTYLVHHLFLDYLRQKADELLTEEEKCETYQTAGSWCDANGYHIDAFSYFEKSGDYSAIAQKITLLNVHIPFETAQYLLNIFENAPDEVRSHNPLFPGLHIRLKMNVGQFNEDTMALAQRYAEDFEARPESPERNRTLAVLYSSFAFLCMLMCTQNDVYDFDVYNKKMAMYYDRNPFKVIGSYKLLPINASISLVGTIRAGAQEEYIDALSRYVPYINHMIPGCFVGFDDLARGELCFYRGEFGEAEQFLKQSIDKAFEFDQFVTYNRALTYLMHLAFFRGDLACATTKLETMKALLNEKDHGVRYTMYDIACGFFYLSLDQPEQAPEWLKGDFSPYSHPAFLENYENRVKAQYHYETRQFSSLLAYIENEMEKKTILFNRIELNVLKALSLYQVKRRGEAVDALTEAYLLAESNKIVVPFTMYAKDMRTLTAFAYKDKKCKIPSAWLENINRKASAYAKRKAKMISDYMIANHLDTGVTLTDREIGMLKDLSQGLSRTEIAASQNISVNTVKMTVNIIYEKLHVTGLPDAVRVAVERKII